MNSLQGYFDAERKFPDAETPKAQVALKVTERSTLRMVVQFDYKDNKSVNDYGKLCIDFAQHFANTKGPGIANIAQIVATVPMPADDDTVLEKNLKLQWVDSLVVKGFTQVRGASKPDAMEVDASGIVEYEKTI